MQTDSLGFIVNENLALEDQLNSKKYIVKFVVSKTDYHITWVLAIVKNPKVKDTVPCPWRNVENIIYFLHRNVIQFSSIL